MIRDGEEDGVGAKAITRAEYTRLVARVAVLLWVIEVAVDLAVRMACEVRFWNWYGCAFAINTLAGRWLIDADLKRRGLSRGGPTVSAWGKSGAAPAGGAMADEAVEVRVARDGLLMPSVICLAASPPALALGIGLAVQGAGPVMPFAAWGVRVGALGLVIVLAVAVGGAGLWMLKKAVAPRRCYRADAAGVTDCRRDRFVAWPDVAACRVTTQHDAVGDPTGATHELTDWRGDTLLTLKLDWLAARDRDRLLAFIRARLPRPIKDDLAGEDW